MTRLHVLIPGGTGGIGLALARRLVSRGHAVGLFARDEAKLAAAVSELGSSAIAIPGDTREEADCQRAVSMMLETYETLDGVAHAIGSIVLRPLHLTRLEDLQAALDINVRTLFLVMKASLKPMMDRKSGSIVAFGSVAGQTGLSNHEAIAAAKAGVAGMVRSAAITYAPYGIRLNTIAPGLVDTPLAAPITRSGPARSASEAMHPLGRIGTPDEVASLAEWLLGPDSSWMTGQVLGHDGGMSAGAMPPRRPG